LDFHPVEFRLAEMAPKAAEEQKAGKSKAEKKPVVKKAEKKIKADTKGEGKKKRSKKSVETYKIYIYKVLKQVWWLLVPQPALSLGLCSVL
jgi:hypothetical protein